MSDPEKASKLAAAEHGDVSVHVWSTATAPQTHILSLGAGSGHFVVTLKSEQTLREMRDFIDAHRDRSKAEWLEIGTFATCAFGVYTNRDGISLICDGDPGFPESFGIRFAGSQLDSLCRALDDTIDALYHAPRGV